MEKNEKYFGVRIIVVNSINVQRVKYKYKFKGKQNFYNFLLATIFVCLFVSGTYLIQGVIERIG